MARRFTAAVQQIKAQLHTRLTPADIHAACQAAGYDWRQRVLGPVLTIQALLLQLLHGSAMTGVSRLTGVAFSAGVERELLAFALLYNLICTVLTVLALHLETQPARVSLLDVLRLLRYGLAHVVTATIVVNPHCPGHPQPRVVKRRPLEYSRITRPRGELKRELLRIQHCLT